MTTALLALVLVTVFIALANRLEAAEDRQAQAS